MKVRDLISFLQRQISEGNLSEDSEIETTTDSEFEETYDMRLSDFSIQIKKEFNDRGETLPKQEKILFLYIEV